MITLTADKALAILRAIDPNTNLVVTAPNPFYHNSDREPRVGDIVECPPSFSGDQPYRYLYTDQTRWIGHNNQYPTNWVSVRYGCPDTGPVNRKVSERTLVSSLDK